ncbi:2-keto-3-deoxy-galactonokinase [Salipiger pallidus]|uniref:2-keto-3-deoxy-galactonokinase n=1 Tax=Salipiger pallidus TaxID=1775170 RepID=A0A8J2ZHK9_9RHOB|nr:2-dehydro-3-deoxygalactonokinase [Salipiger pallidus]GGG65342.1 2-keto-3-deoxy-galactonokinase [Salipiger pallidus]
MTLPGWIAVDWGTSNLRVWAMTSGGEVLIERSSDKGMGTLEPDQFEAAFMDLAGDLLGTGRMTVVVCGMAGARGGWCEAGYVAVPAVPGRGAATRVVTRDPRLDVTILPGLSQADPPDVMRGEETQIAGVLAQFPEIDGVICLPGTHTKWVRVADGRVRTFRTFMTGELFALLSRHSILRQGMDDDWSAEAFAGGLTDGLADPAGLSAALFGLRARGLLQAPHAGETRARLSGLLLGLELAGARPFWDGGKVIVVGDTRALDLYVKLSDLAAEIHFVAAREMTLRGLISAHTELTGGSE